MVKMTRLYVFWDNSRQGVPDTLVDIVEVATSGAGSGWNRGRLPARIGSMMASGRAYGLYPAVNRIKRTAVKIGGRYYTRLRSRRRNK